eukprot:scaffold77596_cov36-Tisochrysis_lutea.AAC.2
MDPRPEPRVCRKKATRRECGGSWPAERVRETRPGRQRATAPESIKRRQPRPRRVTQTRKGVGRAAARHSP